MPPPLRFRGVLRLGFRANKPQGAARMGLGLGSSGSGSAYPNNTGRRRCLPPRCAKRRSLRTRASLCDLAGGTSTRSQRDARERELSRPRGVTQAGSLKASKTPTLRNETDNT